MLKYDLIDKLCPSEPNPSHLQTKIDILLSSNPNIIENQFNEILAEIELLGFKKGIRIGYELYNEAYRDTL